MLITWKIAVTKLHLSENATGSLKKQQPSGVFFKYFDQKTRNIVKERF